MSEICNHSVPIQTPLKAKIAIASANTDTQIFTAEELYGGGAVKWILSISAEYAVITPCASVVPQMVWSNLTDAMEVIRHLCYSFGACFGPRFGVID